MPKWNDILIQGQQSDWLIELWCFWPSGAVGHLVIISISINNFSAITDTPYERERDILVWGFQSLSCSSLELTLKVTLSGLLPFSDFSAKGLASAALPCVCTEKQCSDHCLCRSCFTAGAIPAHTKSCYQLGQLLSTGENSIPQSPVCSHLHSEIMESVCFRLGFFFFLMSPRPFIFDFMLWLLNQNILCSLNTKEDSKTRKKKSVPCIMKLGCV